MKYIQPYDQPSNPTAPYVDLNAAAGVDGSIFPAKFFNNLQAEILAVITRAGLTPSDDDLTQLLAAIQSMIPTPTGAPSDASLVHWGGADTGVANAPVFTPSPTCASVAAGFTILFLPANSITGASTITINLTPSGSVTKNLVRPDGTPTVNGDMPAGRLAAAIYDGTAFRLALMPPRVVSDGVTISGDGSPPNPLSAIPQAAFGVKVGQMVVANISVAGYNSPAFAGFTVGNTYPASQLSSATYSGTNANYIGGAGVNGTNEGNPGIWLTVGNGPVCAVNGTLSGTWRLDGWFNSQGWVGFMNFGLVFTRIL